MGTFLRAQIKISVQGPRSLAYICNDSDNCDENNDFDDVDNDDNNVINKNDDDCVGNGGKA